MTTEDKNVPGTIASAAAMGFMLGLLVELVGSVTTGQSIAPHGVVGMLSLPLLGAVLGAVFGVLTSR